MLPASELRSGLAVRLEGTIYRVLEATYHSGQGKMGGVTHAKLQNLQTGTMREWRFRADEVVEEIVPERQNLQFLYSDGEFAHFMHPDTFEQVAVETRRIGPAVNFLTEGASLPVEFIDGRPVGVVAPEIAEVTVSDTAPPSHGGATNVWKPATLDNGLTIMVPPFIAPGETIRVDVNRGAYVERAKRK